MEARASAKYLRGSSQKARLVIDMIRGKNVGQALAILKYSNKRAGKGIEKCVRSAIAWKICSGTRTFLRRSLAYQESQPYASSAAGPCVSRAPALLSRDRFALQRRSGRDEENKRRQSGSRNETGEAD